MPCGLKNISLWIAMAIQTADMGTQSSHHDCIVAVNPTIEIQEAQVWMGLGGISKFVGVCTLSPEPVGMIH